MALTYGLIQRQAAVDMACQQQVHSRCHSWCQARAHLHAPATLATVQRVPPVIGCDVVPLAINLKGGIGDAVCTTAHDDAEIVPIVCLRQENLPDRLPL